MAILELSTDLGASWTRQAMDGIQSGDPAVGISFTGPSAGWAWTGSGALYVTRDGGATWAPLPFGPNSDNSVVSATLVAGGYQPDQPTGPSIGYLLLREPQRRVTALVETGDGGLTWTEVHTFAIP